MKVKLSKIKNIRRGRVKSLGRLPHEDPGMGLIGIGNSKKGDISTNHDRYLADYKTRRKR